MFAKTIIDSDAFLEMPTTSQLLYFHLAMRADDDGFVNKPKSLMRMVGCKDDDLKLLFLKKFLIPFESGVVVIKHWKIHNYIRKDTYTETKYKEEKASLELDENSAYRLAETTPLQLCDESVTSPSTQERKGKDSTGKDNNTCANFDRFWSLYPKKVDKQGALRSFKKIDVDVEVLIKALENHKRSAQWTKDGGQFIPNPTTWLNQRRWETELPEDRTVPQGASGKLGEAEVEAIRRMFKGG
jgi:hypothetical protein